MAEEGGWRPKVVSERLHRWRWQKKVAGEKCDIVPGVLTTCCTWATTKKQEKRIEVNAMRMLW